MPDSIPIFRIFLSSPGDVPQERDAAEAAIREINDSGEFSHLFILNLYRWDDKTVVLPMPATNTPQESVDIYLTRPSQCDLVVVLFWARMGSPLVMDNSEYLSGTHYEYSEAIQGYKQTGRPIVWLYRCAEEPLLKLNDPKRDEKIRQFDQVDQFFKQFQDSEGRYTGGVNSYLTHSDFKALFKGQLITYMRHLLDKPKTLNVPQKPKFTGIPYHGLSALDEDDAPVFFGRDAETLEVLSRIDNRRLVMVLGASGSGKSSLVAAGVLPKLRERGWRILRCVPGDDPFYSLARAMVSHIPEMDVKPIDYLNEARKLADTLAENPENLAEQLMFLLPKARVLLFIDQFEEVFTLTDKDAANIFIQAVRSPSTNLTTLITLRADFYGIALPHFEALKHEAYGLTKPSIFALYDLITRPAALADLSLEAGLAQHIIEDAGNESGALALIAYVMQALYERAQARGDTCLLAKDYHQLNGVTGAINTLADHAYANLPFDKATREKTLQNVFRELIALTEEDGQLIPTRRRAALSRFAPRSKEEQLINAFVDARLLVKDSQAVEVAHEAILRHWATLKIWIDGIKGDLALYRQYERDAQTWVSGGKNTPPPLHEALSSFYRTLNQLGLTWDSLLEPLKSYTELEAARLLRELNTINTSHRRRFDIGERLARIGDPRQGVGVSNGVPNLVWLPVAPGGDILINKQRFTVQPFYMAQYLITYAQYQAFAESGEYEDPRWWRDFPQQYQAQAITNAVNSNASAPRDSLSWYQSVAFARWLNHHLRGFKLPIPGDPTHQSYIIGDNAQVRLPTEWEWQWAAQNGAEERECPWGTWDTYPRANTTEAGISDRSTAVGMYPHGAAACGAMDMAGNLWEWCANDYYAPQTVDARDDQNKVLRGGSYNGFQNYATNTFRFGNSPVNVYFGLRVYIAAPLAL